MFGEYKQRMRVRIYTDSEPLLESIASTRQIERKNLRKTIEGLKERLMQGDVTAYQWIPTKEMWSDGLTKEMEMAEGLRKLMKTGVCDLQKKEVNKVVCERDEVRMLNIRNRKKIDEGTEK